MIKDCNIGGKAAIIVVQMILCWSCGRWPREHVKFTNERIHDMNDLFVQRSVCSISHGHQDAQLLVKLSSCTCSYPFMKPCSFLMVMFFHDSRPCSLFILILLYVNVALYASLTAYNVVSCNDWWMNVGSCGFNIISKNLLSQPQHDLIPTIDIGYSWIPTAEAIYNHKY